MTPSDPLDVGKGGKAGQGAGVAADAPLAWTDLARDFPAAATSTISKDSASLRIKCFLGSLTKSSAALLMGGDDESDIGDDGFPLGAECVGDKSSVSSRKGFVDRGLSG